MDQGQQIHYLPSVSLRCSHCLQLLHQRIVGQFRLSPEDQPSVVHRLKVLWIILKGLLPFLFRLLDFP